MTCNKFQEWLDEGNSASSVEELPGEYLAHVTSCSGCQKSLMLQNSSIARLKNSVILDEAAKHRIHNKLAARTYDAKVKEPSYIEQLLTWFFMPGHRQWLYCGVSLVLIGALLIVLRPSGPQQASIDLFVSGNGFVTKNHEEIRLSAIRLPLLPGASLKNTGRCSIVWNQQDQVEIDGQAEFIVGENRLRMLNGKTKISFTKSAKGYVIEMKDALLTIVGTVIKLETASDHDSVFVEKGRIQWQHARLAKTGFLEGGQGIRIYADSVAEIEPGPEPVKPQSEPVHDPEINTISDPVLPE